MITFSPYTDQDLPSVLRIWNASLRLDAMTADMFTSRLLLDANFDPATFILAREGANVIGFVLGFHAKQMPLGDADPDGTRSWIVGLGVDEKSDLKLVGEGLLKAIEGVFVSLKKKETYVSSYPPAYITPGIDKKAYASTLDLFRRQGYAETKEALSMDAPIVLFEVPTTTVQKESALAGEGIAFRTYRDADLMRFLDFLERHMPSDWVRVERRNLQSIPTGQFSRDQITVVTKGEEIIGYCQFEGSHFGPFGVSAAYQGRGIGTVLLARTLERMRHMGYHNAWVMWTDEAAAKVYGKFGFTVTRRFAILRREL